MKKIRYSIEQFSIATHLLRWAALITPVAVVIGLLVALFLYLLEWATYTRENHINIIFLLPLAGILISLVYNKFGNDSVAGNNLILDEIHKPGGGVPFKMTPLILISTVITHLFGGSAGREGTAVQMGGSISSLFTKWYKLKNEEKRILLMSGMAAGFGAVFGTPIAGAIFALEVLAIGRIKYDALLPCFFASIVADITCRATGIEHTHYIIHYVNTWHLNASHNETSTFNQIRDTLSLNVPLMLKVVGAGVAFGLAAFIFAQTTHYIKKLSNKYISQKLFIPVIGAIIVISISYLLQTFDYLGLGVTSPNSNGVSIVGAFSPGGATVFSWLFKLLLTAITLGMGFKGGEVTPLFFIGATLGNILAMYTGAPVDLFAGIGFIAVFAGATNTPLACTLMGVELFGSDNVLYFALACFTAYYFSGHSGIYHSQRLAVTKFHENQGEAPTAEASTAKASTAEAPNAKASKASTSIN